MKSELSNPSRQQPLAADSSDRSNRPEGWSDDYSLVQRLVAGDGAAWGEFVERFERLVLARVAATARELGLPVDRAELEDVTAEVFSQLVANEFDALRRFEGRSRLSTWLSVVARRIALRKLAAVRREPWRMAAAAPEALLSSSRGEEPLAALIQGENRELLGQGLARLAERDRQLVALLYVEALSYREISERLAMPMNSIGPTVMRIQKKLRASLEEPNPARSV